MTGKRKWAVNRVAFKDGERNYYSHTAYKTDRKYLRIQAHALSRYKNGGKEVGTRSEEKNKTDFEEKVRERKIKNSCNYITGCTPIKANLCSSQSASDV